MTAHRIHQGTRPLSQKLCFPLEGRRLGSKWNLLARPGRAGTKPLKRRLWVTPIGRWRRDCRRGGRSCRGMRDQRRLGNTDSLMESQLSGQEGVHTDFQNQLPQKLIRERNSVPSEDRSSSFWTFEIEEGRWETKFLMLLPKEQMSRIDMRNWKLVASWIECTNFSKQSPSLAIEPLTSKERRKVRSQHMNDWTQDSRQKSFKPNWLFSQKRNDMLGAILARVNPTNEGPVYSQSLRGKIRSLQKFLMTRKKRRQGTSLSTLNWKLGVRFLHHGCMLGKPSKL